MSEKLQLRAGSQLRPHRYGATQVKTIASDTTQFVLELVMLYGWPAIEAHHKFVPIAKRWSGFSYCSFSWGILMNSII